MSGGDQRPPLRPRLWWGSHERSVRRIVKVTLCNVLVFQFTLQIAALDLGREVGEGDVFALASPNG